MVKETWSLLGSMRPAVSLVLAGFIRALLSEACWRPRGFWMESADWQWVCPGKQEGEMESAGPPLGRGLPWAEVSRVGGLRTRSLNRYFGFEVLVSQEDMGRCNILYFISLLGASIQNTAVGRVAGGGP